MASLALSWVSGVSKRARTEVPSSPIRSVVTPASSSAACTRASTAASTLTVALAEETWTAGASPKKLGRVYKIPTNSATTMIAYFQTG